MFARWFAGIARAVVMLGAAVLCSHAQDQWKWPDKFKNLKVFPKEWSSKELRPVMREFAVGLGVRCTYCHVGEEGQPLSTYDFPSDNNPNKDRAREMYRMLGDIKNHLAKIEPSGDRRVEASCYTCHRGRPRPMTLEEELAEKYRLEGLESALAYYADLKKKYYGRGAYDFGERSLIGFGHEVEENNDPAGSIRVLELNAQEFPESSIVWKSLADAQMKAGNIKTAQQYYEKALTLDPKNEGAREMLKKIKENSPN